MQQRRATFAEVNCAFKVLKGQKLLVTPQIERTLTNAYGKQICDLLVIVDRFTPKGATTRASRRPLIERRDFLAIQAPAEKMGVHLT